MPFGSLDRVMLAFGALHRNAPLLRGWLQAHDWSSHGTQSIVLVATASLQLPRLACPVYIYIYIYMPQLCSIIHFPHRVINSPDKLPHSKGLSQFTPPPRLNLPSRRAGASARSAWYFTIFLRSTTQPFLCLSSTLLLLYLSFRVMLSNGPIQWARGNCALNCAPLPRMPQR